MQTVSYFIINSFFRTKIEPRSCHEENILFLDLGSYNVLELVLEQLNTL